MSLAVQRPAAFYLRMSTDMQGYSLEQQTAALQAYAEKHDLRVVRTYEDEGKSGLTVKGRPAMKALLVAVESQPDFDVLLVYDVSRWGRFQDQDEAAYYEYLCRRAGVEVRYIAEPFASDRSPMAELIKSIKRAMAAEYSRELSVKCSRGQRQGAAAGRMQGGVASYGLRRKLVDENGDFIAYLPRGGRALRPCRTVFVPGDPIQVAIVQLIFWLFVEQGLHATEIARRLNAMEVGREGYAPWSGKTISHVLSNTKYAGDYVFGRKRNVLGKRQRKLPPEFWIKVEGAIKPIVDRETFDRAQRIVYARSGKMTDTELLARLRHLLAIHGRLSRSIINQDIDTPNCALYAVRFGSLKGAYAAVGWSLAPNCRCKCARCAEARSHLASSARGARY